MIPSFVLREFDALVMDGCTEVEISDFDEGIWAIEYTADGKRQARLCWSVDVDV